MKKIQEIKIGNKNHFGELNLNQAHYTKTFLPTAIYLDKQGFYKKITDFVQKGDMIIDVGCGDCRLIHYLKEENKDATIIGIDINQFMLQIGGELLKKHGHEVNLHYGTNIAMDPETKKLSLISDIVTQEISYEFKKGFINLLQEDFRFCEVLRNMFEKVLEPADVITYTMPGGFSPHGILEKGEKNYNSVEAGIEMNRHVLALGVELLKDNGRMIWAVRAGSQDPEKFLSNMDLDGLNLSIFKHYYDVNRVEIVHVDEQKLELSLPAYTIEKDIIHYTKDIRKMKHDFKIVVLLIEMIKK